MHAGWRVLETLIGADPLGGLGARKALGRLTCTAKRVKQAGSGRLAREVVWLCCDEIGLGVSYCLVSECTVVDTVWGADEGRAKRSRSQTRRDDACMHACVAARETR